MSEPRISYETFLYHTGRIEPGTEETCGHEHPTLDDAWACARSFDAEHPFDVVLLVDDMVLYDCRREDEPS